MDKDHRELDGLGLFDITNSYPACANARKEMRSAGFANKDTSQISLNLTEHSGIVGSNQLKRVLDILIDNPGITLGSCDTYLQPENPLTPAEPSEHQPGQIRGRRHPEWSRSALLLQGGEQICIT